tara:strand:- start:111 stop:308 length:198 start_codon:yes stop_codon:yes gene_type:complete
MIQKTKLKKAFNDEGLQISPDALEMLASELQRTAARWVSNAKTGNIKRLTLDLIWIALGRGRTHK